MAKKKHDIQRLVIDGMTSYSSAIEDQPVYRDFFHALVAFSKYRLMTTFFNYENPELFGISAYMPDFPVSSIRRNLPSAVVLIVVAASPRTCGRSGGSCSSGGSR